MDKYQTLTQIADGRTLFRVESTIIPAPLGSEHPGNHLLVNCLCRPNFEKENPVDILRTLRGETLCILQKLVAEKLLSAIVSICITFLSSNQTGKAFRLYRYSVLCSCVPDNFCDISENCFQFTTGAIESSDIDLISKILTNNRA